MPFASTRRAAATLSFALSTRAVAIDGDELSQLHAVAEHGNLHQRALDEGRGAARNARDERGRIEIGDVVGHEDAGGVRGHMLQARRSRRESPPAGKASRTILIASRCRAASHCP